MFTSLQRISGASQIECLKHLLTLLLKPLVRPGAFFFMSSNLINLTGLLLNLETKHEIN
jgi:hypothetical protein